MRNILNIFKKLTDLKRNWYKKPNVFTAGKSGSGMSVILRKIEKDVPNHISWKDSFLSKEDGEICIGESASGNVKINLNYTPHAIITGSEASGKTVLSKTILRQMALQGTKIFMVDFNDGLEFGVDYEEFVEFITEPERALLIVETLIEENQKRLGNGNNPYRIALIINDMEKVFDKKGVGNEEEKTIKKLEINLSILAAISKGTAINIFLVGKWFREDTLTEHLKNNIPVRICGKFIDKSISEMVLGTLDATKLPDKSGRFLLKKENIIEEFQAYHFDDYTMLASVN